MKAGRRSRPARSDSSGKPVPSMPVGARKVISGGGEMPEPPLAAATGAHARALRDLRSRPRLRAGTLHDALAQSVVGGDLG